ncbi:OadG family protein [bacterium]|nr:OadG family protein [bacterium]
MWAEALSIAGLGILMVFITLTILTITAWLIGKLSYALGARVATEPDYAGKAIQPDRAKLIAVISSAIKKYEEEL